MLITTHFIRHVVKPDHILAVVSAKNASVTVAKTLESRTSGVRVTFERVLHVFDKFDRVSSSSPFQGIWFGHSQQRVFTVCELQSCHKWASLNAVLRKRLLSPENGVLAIYFGFSSNGIVWKDSAIDYVVSGVERASLKHSYSKPRVVYVSRFVLRHPRAIVIFRYGRDDENVTIQEKNESMMPKEFMEQHSHWDYRRRLKMATKNMQKFRVCVPYMVSLLKQFRCTHVLLYEPGGFYVAPALMSCIPRVSICTRDDDDVQYQEFVSRGYRNVLRLDENITLSQNTYDALILMETCPKRAFLERWDKVLTNWLSCLCRASVLIVMSRSDNHDWLHTYLSSSSSAQSCSVLSRDMDVMLVSTGLKYYVSVVVIVTGNDGDDGRRLVKTWNATSHPPIVSIRACKVKFSSSSTTRNSTTY